MPVFFVLTAQTCVRCMCKISVSKTCDFFDSRRFSSLQQTSRRNIPSPFFLFLLNHRNRRKSDNDLYYNRKGKPSPKHKHKNKAEKQSKPNKTQKTNSFSQHKTHTSRDGTQTWPSLNKSASDPPPTRTRSACQSLQSAAPWPRPRHGRPGSWRQTCSAWAQTWQWPL